jgi:endonuclease IV
MAPIRRKGMPARISDEHREEINLLKCYTTHMNGSASILQGRRRHHHLLGSGEKPRPEDTIKKITSSPQYKGNAPNKGTQAYTDPCGWTII